MAWGRRVLVSTCQRQRACINRLGGYWFIKIDLFPLSTKSKYNILFRRMNFTHVNTFCSKQFYRICVDAIADHHLKRTAYSYKINQFQNGWWCCADTKNEIRLIIMRLFWNFSHSSKISHQIRPITFSQNAYDSIETRIKSIVHISQAYQIMSLI